MQKSRVGKGNQLRVGGARRVDANLRQLEVRGGGITPGAPGKASEVKRGRDGGLTSAVHGPSPRVHLLRRGTQGSKMFSLENTLHPVAPSANTLHNPRTNPSRFVVLVCLHMDAHVCVGSCLRASAAPRTRSRPRPSPAPSSHHPVSVSGLRHPETTARAPCASIGSSSRLRAAPRVDGPWLAWPSPTEGHPGCLHFGRYQRSGCRTCVQGRVGRAGRQLSEARNAK